MIRYLTNLALEYRGKIFWLLVIQVGHAALISLHPYFFQQIVSLAMKDLKAVLFPDGLRLLGYLSLIYVSGTLLQSLYGYIACIFSSDLLKQLQLEFFEKLSRLPLTYFQHESAGEFMTKFNNDIGQTQGLVASSLPMVLRELLTIIIVMIILFFSCSAILMIAALGFITLTSMLIMKLNQTLKGYAMEQRAKWGEINKIFDETIQGIDTIKIFAGEEPIRQHFGKQTRYLRHLCVKAGIITAVVSPLIDLISKFGGLVLVLIAYYLIARESLSTEQFLLFFFYAGLLGTSVSSLINELSNIQPQLISVGNIASFFSEYSEAEANVSKNSARLKKSVTIRIEGLHFSYPHGLPLFKEANLVVPANGITLLHGPSGSGKSTLINLLLRFHNPTRGQIQMGDLNIENFAKKELRKKISVVTQYHYIFHDTLKKNLSIARPDAKDQDIINALKKAHLGEFLDRLPNGINEIMDPRGKGISGGERQRICIARLLLRNSPIIILDEPWSNLDADARETLIQVINLCKINTTILILTHEALPSLAIDCAYRLIPEKGTFEKSMERFAIDPTPVSCLGGMINKHLP